MAKPVTATEVLAQFHMAGLLQFCQSLDALEVGADSITGTVDLRIIDYLREHPCFNSPGLHHLHPEVGNDRVEFRCFRNKFGPGSLQVVIGRDTCRFHADVDLFNPGEDLVGGGGHTWEVVRNWFEKWFT